MNNHRIDNEKPSYPKDESPKSTLKEIYEWVDSAVLSVVVIILLFTFVFRIVGIRGESMENTLFNGNRVVISNLFYTPKNGDIVVISRNYLNVKGDTSRDDSPIIKRVIATEGQTLTIDSATGSVYVDGVKLNEDYIKDGAVTTWEDGTTDAKSVTVPEDCIFVMGDNRTDSMDSRFQSIGMVDTRYVLGKAFLRIYPFNDFGGLY